MSSSETYDIAILGAGPSGLFAAFEAGSLKLSFTIIDTLPEAGGQCTALYPEKPIYDIPALPSVLGSELINNLLKQIERFKPKFIFKHMVESYTKNPDSTFSINIKNNISKEESTISAKSIIIAAGGGSFTPNKPNIENLSKYEDYGVDYLVTDKSKFKDKDILIAGGGDSAVDWAITLSEIAHSVTVIHRRSKFRASPDTVEQMHNLAENNKIKLEIPYQISTIEGEENRLTSTAITNIDTKETKTIKTDNLLLFFGLAMNIGFLKDWNLEWDEHKMSIAVDNTTMQTNIEGIYAIGDICTYKNKLKLILTGFSEAAFALHAIRQYLKPNEILSFQYSTTLLKE